MGCDIIIRLDSQGGGGTGGLVYYVVRFLLHKTAGRIPRTRQPSGNSRFYAHVYEYQGRLYMRKVGLQCIHIRVLISTSEKPFIRIGEEGRNKYICARVLDPPPLFRQPRQFDHSLDIHLAPRFLSSQCPLPSLSKLSSAMKVHPLLSTHTAHADPLP